MIDLKNAQQISEYLRKVNSYQYKWAVKNLKDIYRDAWDYIIEDELRKQFRAESVNAMHITKEMNIMKRVVNEISMIYKQPAERSALVGDTEDAVYQEISDGLDVVMKNVNRYTNLTNATLLRVVWRDGIDYDIINFDNAEILTDPDDWKKIIAIKFYVGATLPAEKDNEVISTWGGTGMGTHNSGGYMKYSHGYIFTTDSEAIDEPMRGKIIRFESDGKTGERYTSTEDSPYKKDGQTVLPFVLFTKSEPVDTLIDYTSGSDLIDINVVTAMSLIHINALIKHQSWRQLAITTQNPEKVPEGYAIAPDRIITLEGDRDFTPRIDVLDLQANIRSLYDVILDRVRAVIAQYGVDADSFTRSGNAESGYKLRVKKEGLLEIREDQLPLYRQAERKLFEITRIVNNTHNTRKINEQAEFSIDFAEMQFSSSPEEESRDWILKITHNAASVADWVRDINPDLTEDEAVQTVNDNRTINNDLGFSATPLNAERLNA